ncbi:MAG: GNAT family N-acetyltransferase [Anaerolineales bacterium]
MKTFILRPADPERDFGQVAAWFSTLEDEPTSEHRLVEYYEKHRERIIQKVAEDEQGQLLGFCWIIGVRLKPESAAIHLFVKPEERGQGIGRQLYNDLVHTAENTPLKRLHVSIVDNRPEYKIFAEQRGFAQRRHEIKMMLDLAAFEDRLHEDVITKLRGEGFEFTSMEALGNTEEAQRKLYSLNIATDVETPGSNGKPAWDSFDDFQKSVCLADWYKPGGQLVVIDTTNGNWVAMCAITRLDWHDHHANILYTGVDAPYRRRKLAQAVKVLALRYARDVLKVNMVYTDNNAQNLPIIALNQKLGYTRLPGIFLMEKVFE